MHAARAGTFHNYPYVLLLAGIALLPAATAYSAFYVDDADIDEVGSCSVESWISYASNKDFMAVTSPTCVVKIGVPVEIGTEYHRSRESSEWKTRGGFSGKVALLPITNGVGIALSGQASWNLLSGASNGGYINVPVTFELSHHVRLNVNGGWLYDGPTKLGYAVWGSSVEWTIDPKVALVAEVFSQAGARGETVATTQPRFQTGIRYSPLSNLSTLTVIYGRNLNGENSKLADLGFHRRISKHTSRT